MPTKKQNGWTYSLFLNDELGAIVNRWPRGKLLRVCRKAIEDEVRLTKIQATKDNEIAVPMFIAWKNWPTE